MSVLVSMVLIGAIAAFTNDGSSARGMTGTRNIVAATTDAGIAILEDLAFLFLITSPDGQDSLTAAYVMSSYIPLLLLGGWTASAAINRMRR